MASSGNIFDQSIKNIYKQNRQIQDQILNLRRDRIKLAEELQHYIYKKTNMMFLTINKANENSKFLEFEQEASSFDDYSNSPTEVHDVIDCI